MEFRYPNGKKYVKQITEKHATKKQKDICFARRGMTLEEDLNETNQFYLSRNIAVIHKKPTPIQIVDVSYPSRSTAVIKEAYFRHASTTDYNGVFKGKYIDFEAKETKSSTSFPLKNFHTHQIEHMKAVIDNHGICFVIIRFSVDDEVYLLDAQFVLTYWERMISGGRKSIKKQEIVENGHPITLGFQPRLDYLKIVSSVYKHNFV